MSQELPKMWKVLPIRAINWAFPDFKSHFYYKETWKKNGSSFGLFWIFDPSIQPTRLLKKGLKVW
jgi:hypothetical protein